MIAIKTEYCVQESRRLHNAMSSSPDFKLPIEDHVLTGVLLLLLLPILCRAASSAALSHTGGFRVGGGVHDSYTFQCGLVGSFTSPGIDTR